MALPEPASLFIGLMSGTSTDGVDAVLAEFPPAKTPRLIAQASLPMPQALRAEFLALNTPGHDELARGARAGNELALLYAQACRQLLEMSGVAVSHIRAIGAHGQTVRHDPKSGYSIQINAPALLAELTGIDVIADFRSRDIAAGGQGAPLVPAFHAAQFGSTETRVVLNLGGIANITVLHADGTLSGFDTGPANMLMDAWIQHHRDLPYDADGSWAASGQVEYRLLAHMLSDPWFALTPPKSTGRDDFNLPWLMRQLSETFGQDSALWPAPEDVQASLLQLTAHSVAAAVKKHAPGANTVLVCGGGARNVALMSTLQAHLACDVALTDSYRLPAQWVEAAAFAWLAWCYVQRRPAGLPAVTGARRPNILGTQYLA